MKIDGLNLRQFCFFESPYATEVRIYNQLKSPDITAIVYKHTHVKFVTQYGECKVGWLIRQHITPFVLRENCCIVSEIHAVLQAKKCLLWWSLHLMKNTVQHASCYHKCVSTACLCWYNIGMYIFQPHRCLPREKGEKVGCRLIAL